MHKAGNELVTALVAHLVGVNVVWLPNVDSTSSELRRRLEARELSGPTLLLTDAQTQGRGTRGREWVQGRAAAGRDLALTLAVPLAEQWLAEPRLSLLLGAQVALAVERVTELSVGVKWPNDLLLAVPGTDGSAWRKAGGMLLETMVDHAGQRWLLCGIGINVNSRAADYPDALVERLTTVSEARGRPADRMALHLAVAQQVTGLLLDPGVQDVPALLQTWQRRDKTGGAHYRLLRDGLPMLVEALHVELASGMLVVRLPNGHETTVHSYTELEAG